MLVDRDSAGAAQVLARVRAAGGEAVVETADVRDPMALKAVAQRTVERWRRIDVLVANAGIARPEPPDKADPERSASCRRDEPARHDLRSARRVAAMLARLGHIFVTASVAGREAYPGEAVYIASKWGQVGLAHALPRGGERAGVRVTLVEPGIVDTPLTRDNPVVRPLLEAAEPLARRTLPRRSSTPSSSPPTSCSASSRSGRCVRARRSSSAAD